MERHLREYEAVWRDRDEGHNLAQKHEDAIIAAELRPEVNAELRSDVEAELDAMIANVNKLAPAKKGKKKKGQKGKKGTKGKKGKKLPGEKDCADKDVGQMLSILVSNKIINPHREDMRLEHLVGEFNYLGSAYVNTNTPGQRDAAGVWLAPDPSVSQIRAAALKLDLRLSQEVA